MGIGHAKKSRSAKQLHLIPRDWTHEFNHGGTLRRLRKGRGRRPLSSKDPIHLVFKINQRALRVRSLRNIKVFPILQRLVNRYAKKFFIRIDKISFNHDHVHILIRSYRRDQYLAFFRVLSGQIAQVLEKEGFINRWEVVTDTPAGPKRQAGEWLGGRETELREGRRVGREKVDPRKLLKRWSLWKFRPFSRVVRGRKAFVTAVNYIQLNEKEALGVIRYSKSRLRGLSTGDWELLWS